MEKITVYSVTLTGTHEVQGGSTQDAIDKTVAYFAANLTELDYQVVEREVWLNSEE